MTREEALNECVSRDKAIVQLNHLQSDWDDDWNVAIRKCIETIKILPSVTPQQKIGKWIYKKEEDSYKCSLCGFPCHKDNLGAIPTMYCAGCGANMQEVQDE